MTFRPWTNDDLPFLLESLHRSLHVPEGAEPFPRSVLEDPAIAHYLERFGTRAGDDAQVCTGPGDERVGAAWCRRLPAEDPGYGFVEATIPELGMAVAAERRGLGIGRRLLRDLLERQPVMSLSVDARNVAAVALYRSLGFETVDVVEGSITMLCRGPDRPTAQ